MDEETRQYLREHNPSLADYLSDSEDNMDGWEGQEETFYEVFKDFVRWHKSENQ